MNGWISLHRSIIEHWIWQDPVKLKWWLDILMCVNHEDAKVNVGMQLIECKRGQCIRSLQNWGQRWGVSKDKARSFFDLLKKDNMIQTENLTKTTRITVCKYDDYQRFSHANSLQSHSNVAPNSLKTHTNNNEKQLNNENKLYSCQNMSEVGTSVPQSNKIDFKVIVDLYHSICMSYPRITKLSNARKKKIRIRFEEMDRNMETLRIIFEKMEKSKFMCGDNKNGWKASFDWVFDNEINWCKIVEGNYDNKIGKGNNSSINDLWKSSVNDEWK